MRQYSYQLHFSDKLTSPERLRDFPKMAQLGSARLGLAAGHMFLKTSPCCLPRSSCDGKDLVTCLPPLWFVSSSVRGVSFRNHWSANNKKPQLGEHANTQEVQRKGGFRADEVKGVDPGSFRISALPASTCPLSSPGSYTLTVLFQPSYLGLNHGEKGPYLFCVLLP